MESLRNQFLIAMPGLQDSNFSHTLTYICEHNESGALGIVINQPLSIRFAEMLSQMEDAEQFDTVPDLPVMFGGPVQEDRGFILHSDEQSWEHTMDIAPGIALSTSRDVLFAIAAQRGPRDSLIALGYAGWGAGQLEEELAGNAWLSGPASGDIIFQVPSGERLQAAAEALGVDYQRLSSQSGHA